jgi:hypothetical protein
MPTQPSRTPLNISLSGSKSSWVTVSLTAFGGRELDDVVPAHAGKEVQAERVPRGDTRQAGSGDNPVAEQAAHASACGPPPEMPQVTNRSRPRSSAMAVTSWATSATLRSGLGVDPP